MTPVTLDLHAVKSILKTGFTGNFIKMHWLGECAESKGTKRKVTPPLHPILTEKMSVQYKTALE